MTSSDDTLMLGEDETLALLHAGRTGTEPPLPDVTPIALRDGMRLRRRRQVGQVGVGALLAGAAALALIVATPALNSEGRGDLQIADSAPDSVISAEDAQLVNVRVLAEALGLDFDVVHPGAGSPYIAPKPGSAAERALPAGWAARADVIVATGAGALRCEPDADRADGATTCAPRTLDDGREVMFETRGGALKPDTRAEVRRVHFVQDDGDAIAVTLTVMPEDVVAGTVPRDALNAWLAPYERALISAATNGEMAPGSAFEREAAVAGEGPDDGTAHTQNLRVLQIHLGKDFERANPDAMPPFQDSLAVKPGSATAKALPTDYDARADVSVFGSPEDYACDPAAGAGSGDTCTTRELPDGRTVVLRAGSNPLEASVPVEVRHVYFIQPDGDVVGVSLSVLPSFVRDLGGTVPRAQARAWLAQFEEALIAAATDPEMSPGTVSAPERRESAGDALSRNQVLLADHLGPAFRANGRKVLFAADGAAYPSLPGYMTEAVLRSGRSAVELDRMCDESFDDEHTATCERRATPGGDVIVQTWADSGSDLGTNGRTAVYFLNPDHDGVVIHLVVREFAPPPPATAQERTNAILAWLRSFEDALIAAATDPRVTLDGEAF